MNQKIKVLYIDDELQNLHSFKAAFRLDYTVLTANTISEAYEQLEKHKDINVILCDQRMPEKEGVELLEEVRQQYPAPVRMLITGYTDIESVIQAINRGNVFRYIRKPWQELDVKSAIEEGYNFYLTNSMLRVKNEELEKAYKELDKFAYSVTHDLRGPILSAMGVIDLAKSIDDMEELKEILMMVEKAMQKLDNFIENTHDYYKLNRGELQIVEVDIKEIIEDLRDVYEMNGAKDGTRFITSVTQNESLRTDKVSLYIILNNLLSNAFKYQQKEVSEKFVSLDFVVDKGMATINVRDNGIGISDLYIKNIFDMFYRATSDGVGSGFGLYNVKDAVQKLQGEVKVESRLKEGTHFTITLPNK